MDRINVLYYNDMPGSIDKECQKLIISASPRVKFTDASDLYRAQRSGDTSVKSKLDALLAEAEVIFGRPPENPAVRAPKLKWVQVTSAGVDRWQDTGIMESPVILTNVSGIHSVPISEFVLSEMLMFVKHAPEFFASKQSRRWQRIEPSVLRGKTVGIVGLGSIGREVARLAQAFGMTVLAMRRSAHANERARYVDQMLPSQKLEQLLAESDFVVIAVPYTAETIGLIAEKELRAMKPTAYIINIARGGIIDEDVLIRALKEHWIAGAGLDVFATEPLPPTSKLWEPPNVIFSPHVAGGHEGYLKHATEVFIDNLRRYINGQRLRNVVNKERGY
jgi:phosphoglycerate dehydrogenase-like enzyme